MPVDKTMGSIAVKLTPVSGTSQQAVLRLYGTENDDIGIYYNSSGAFQYEMRKDGIPFANMTIAPPTGKSFANKEVILTFEAVKNTDRKYAKSQKEESAVFRVSCPVINYEKVVQQDILWNWKHTAETITPADSANARGFAYLNFLLLWQA
jgi:hypothetical protein